MQEYQQKIGELICRIRSQKGLTQKDLAVKLGTSQSAINRIEAGKQNVTLEMLARISDVLNKELVSLSNNSVSLKVDGGHTLSGSIDVKVSKNATVGLLCAALLNRGTTTLKKVPKIEEVYRLIEVLVSIGVKVTWHDNGDVEIKPPKELELSKMNAKAARRTRSVIMYLGALMHRYDSFRLPYAGGCKLGKRTVSPHLYALEEFGVKVETKNNYYLTSVKKKQPKDVTLYEMGETVSENVLMAAALTQGETIIRGISSNYMVQDMCFFLEACGVRIEGKGTNTLQAVRDEIAKGIYEEFSKELGTFMGVSDVKLTNTLLGVAGTTMMLGKVANWTVNALSGNIQVLIESAGKRYFNTKDVGNAKIELGKRTKDVLEDVSK